MKTKTFKGGVHAPDNKHWTKDKPIEVLPLPRKAVIPLQQHTGAACEPLVREGDTVVVGQKIGDSKSFISAPVHASIGGKVTAIQPLPHPVLPDAAPAVVIETEEPSSAQGSLPPQGDWSPSAGVRLQKDWQRLAAQEIKALIREAGIVGLGGAAFPTHVKLSPPGEKKIDTLIVNGVECEPYLTNDHRLMLEQGPQILEGTRILLKVLGISRAFIGIEANKPDALRYLGQLTDSLDAGIEVAALKVKYPQGAEKQLIKALLKREVPSGGLPFDVGVVVQNVGTALAVYEAVVLGKPLIERVLTVSGDGIREPKNLKVRLGTSFAQVLEACGGSSADGEVKVIMGGPMMGISQYSLEVPVIKGTSGILVFRQARQERETPCIKCGRCVEVCPMLLMPNRITDYAEKDNFALCDSYGVRDCFECGACAYVCDAKRPMVHWIKYAKWNLARKK